MHAVRTLCLCAVALLVAAPALAAPLGLNPGDEVTQLEWSNDNTGGLYTTGSPGTVAIDGDIQSVTIAPATTTGLSGVSFSLDLDLFSQSVIPLGGSNVLAVANFVGSSSITPDFAISDNTGVILFGNLTTQFVMSGFLNLAAIVNPTFDGAANIIITGGNPNLVDSLGGLGGTGKLTISGGISNFSPSLGALLADTNAFNSNFSFSGTGIITPDATAPFVPEPSTALLLGGGMLGLLGVSRRARSRRA